MPTRSPIIDRAGSVAIARLVMSLCFTIILTSNALAQKVEGVTAEASSEWHFRHELFQMLLEERGLKAVSLDEALPSPRDSVVVMLGTHRVNKLQMQTEYLSIFMAQGGTVLLALDSTASIGGIASFTSTSITSEDSATQYQGHSDCLRVTNLEHSHPLTKGLSEIIVNRSGWLMLQPQPEWMSWEVLATVPETCSPRRCRGQPLIAVRHSDLAGAGTMIVAADPSLFTNGMLWHGDNALFAIRVSELLCRGEKRRLAFIVDGQPLPSYRASPLLQKTAKPQPQPRRPTTVPIPNAPPPKPTLETTLRLANSVIQNVEESNILNEALINQPRPVNRRLYTWIVLVGLLAIMGAWLALRSEHTAAVTPPAPSPRTMKTAQALLKVGDERKHYDDQAHRYGEAAQTLARGFCQELTAGDPHSSDCWHCLDNPAIQPSLERMSASQRRELAGLIELAASSDAPHISSRRLQQIGLVIHSLRGLHRDVLLQARETAGRVE